MIATWPGKFQNFSCIEFLFLKRVNLPEKEDQELEDSISKFYGDEIEVMLLRIDAIFYAPSSKTKLPASKKSIMK